MSDSTARLLEVVARIKAEQDARESRPPRGAAVAPAPAPVEEPAGPIPAPEPAAPVDPAGFGEVLKAAGVAVGFKVPGIDVELFLVADEAHAAELGREGIGRGRCWTPAEIRMVIGLSVAGRQAVAITKVEIDGMVEDVIDDA